MSKREITLRTEIDDFIQSCSVVRIGMISDSEPYIVPLNFVYLDGCIWFHCALDGRKTSTFRSGDLVCMEFDEMSGVDVKKQTTYYTSVIAWGIPGFVTDKFLAKRVLKELCIKYLKEETEITESMLQRTGVVKVLINKITAKERLP